MNRGCSAALAAGKCASKLPRESVSLQPDCLSSRKRKTSDAGEDVSKAEFWYATRAGGVQTGAAAAEGSVVISQNKNKNNAKQKTLKLGLEGKGPEINSRHPHGTWNISNSGLKGSTALFRPQQALLTCGAWTDTQTERLYTWN